MVPPIPLCAPVPLLVPPGVVPVAPPVRFGSVVVELFGLRVVSVVPEVPGVPMEPGEVPVPGVAGVPGCCAEVPAPPGVLAGVVPGAAPEPAGGGEVWAMATPVVSARQVIRLDVFLMREIFMMDSLGWLKVNNDLYIPVMWMGWALHSWGARSMPASAAGGSANAVTIPNGTRLARAGRSTSRLCAGTSLPAGMHLTDSHRRVPSAVLALDPLQGLSSPDRPSRSPLPALAPAKPLPLRYRFWQLVHSLKVGILTTRSGRGILSSRRIEVRNTKKHCGSLLYFLASIDDLWVRDISGDPQVAVVFSVEDRGIFVSVCGTARLWPCAPVKSLHSHRTELLELPFDSPHPLQQAVEVSITSGCLEIGNDKQAFNASDFADPVRSPAKLHASFPVHTDSPIDSSRWV